MKPKYTTSVDLTKVSSFEEYVLALDKHFKSDVPVDRNFLEDSKGEPCPECKSKDTFWSFSHHLICNKCGTASQIILA